MLTKRSKALGDENKMKQSKLHVHAGPYNAVIHVDQSGTVFGGKTQMPAGMKLV